MPGYENGIPNLSSDGSILYFLSSRPGGFGGWDLWQVTITPVVDFNADGIVDSIDICMMVDYWGTDESLYDIAPSPFGDGIVDIQDLIVLAEYLFGDIQCVAHFMLDEAKGSIVNDSARNRDGIVYGTPEWRPSGGVLGGALQLDGVDDYVRIGSMLNPADVELSVFVWVKDGAPGQAVLSQKEAANWLCVDPIEGYLMTELESSGRSGRPLLSRTVITDGKWHQIGLVWDCTNRTLYVDGAVVAEDTQDDLGSSNNSLYIGTDKAMESGTFWSGLIDDVRIYNRVVIP
jgi:hypothetical protein